MGHMITLRRILGGSNSQNPFPRRMDRQKVLRITLQINATVNFAAYTRHRRMGRP